MRAAGTGHLRVVLGYWLSKIKNIIKEEMVSRNIKINEWFRIYG